MSKIKKWFDQKKVEYKFSKMGPGHRLQDSGQQSSSRSVSQQQENITPRQAPSSSAKSAGAAAIARFETQEKNKGQPRLGLHGNLKETIEQQIESELQMEEQQKKLFERFQQPAEVEQTAAPVLAVSGVYFKCSLISPESLPFDSWMSKIRSFLSEQMSDEPVICTAVLIKTLNSSEKVELCLTTICRYLDNIITNPEEEKFRKIRLANKVFQDKVHPACDGALDFLQGCGFVVQMCDSPDGSSEEYLVLPSSVTGDQVKEFRETLLTSDAIEPELDRCTTLYELTTRRNLNQMRLPDDFFVVNARELELESQRLRLEVESQEMLKTKAMRQQERVREVRRYKFTLIRVRLPPEGRQVLQATFHANEPLAAVLNWLRHECLHEGEDLSFNLISPGNEKLSDPEASLTKLGLCPAAVLNLHLLQPLSDKQSLLQSSIRALQQPLP